MATSLSIEHLYVGVPNTTRGEPSHLASDPTGLTDNIVYASGRVAVIRSISNPLDARVFTAHTAPVTSATFSRDGTLIASGDAHGTIRLWNPKNAVQFKAPMEVMAGPIRDLAFDQKGKFIACVGECRGAYAKVVKVPTGGSAGACAGHSKTCISCDIGNGLVATGGEDMTVGVFKGPPVREIDTPTFFRHHTAFVNDVKFSDGGEYLAIASSDRKISVLDTAGMNIVAELEGHGASVTGLSWVGEDKLISSSNDKTCKMWSVPSGECLWTKVYGKDVKDMQVGCTVMKKTGEVVSASLKSEILVCDGDGGDTKTVLRGHSKQIVGLAAVGGRFYSADYSGLIVAWENGVGNASTAFNGKGPANSVCSLDANDQIVANVGMDGKIFVTPTTSLTFGKPVTVKGGGVGIAVPSASSSQYSCIMINETRMVAVDPAGESVVAEMRFGNGHTGCSVAVTGDGSLIAVGLQVPGEAGELHFYALNGSSFAMQGDALKMRSAPNRISFSPDESTIAVGEKSRRVKLYNVASREPVTGGGVVHTARVDAICFSPDNRYAASGGMDGSVAIWPVNSEEEPIKLKMAHRNGVTGIAFIDASTVLTSGGDSCLRTWKL